LGDWQRKLFDLHVKHVDPIDYDHLFSLRMPSRLRQTATSYFSLLDAANYPTIPQDEICIRTTSLSKQDELSLGCKVASISSAPRAGVFGFKVAEVEKRRCRPVWACDINDYNFTPKPPPIKLHSSQEIANIMAEAEVFIGVDGKSMYDQFPLPPGTREFYVFRTHSNELAALATLPAGFKYAPGIAQCTSEILGFTEETFEDMICHLIIHLDNFGFAFKRRPGASEAQLWSAICKRFAVFCQRCAHVGFQLNELNMETVASFPSWDAARQRETLRPLAPTTFVFLGVEYNLHEPTNKKRVAQKTLTKLQAVAQITCPSPTSVNPNISYRQLAMVVGIVRHISRVMELKHQDFQLYRVINEMAAKVCAEEALWDQPIGLPAAVRLSTLGTLINKILHLPFIPVRIPLDLDSAHTLIVDASKTGWGALHFRPNQQNFEIVARKWDSRDYGSSVTAEPQAVLAVLRHLNLPSKATVVIASDHSGLVDSSRSVQAHAYQYHRVLAEIGEKWNVHLVFVPGKDNPADAPSRGLPMVIPAGACRALRAAAGAGAAWAYTFLQSPPSVLVPTGDPLGKDDYATDTVT
jgi:hypothetical protein